MVSMNGARVMYQLSGLCVQYIFSIDCNPKAIRRTLAIWEEFLVDSEKKSSRNCHKHFSKEQTAFFCSFLYVQLDIHIVQFLCNLKRTTAHLFLWTKVISHYFVSLLVFFFFLVLHISQFLSDGTFFCTTKMLKFVDDGALVQLKCTFAKISKTKIPPTKKKLPSVDTHKKCAGCDWNVDAWLLERRCHSRAIVIRNWLTLLS